MLCFSSHGSSLIGLPFPPSFVCCFRSGEVRSDLVIGRCAVTWSSGRVQRPGHRDVCSDLVYRDVCSNSVGA